MRVFKSFAIPWVDVSAATAENSTRELGISVRLILPFRRDSVMLTIVLLRTKCIWRKIKAAEIRERA